MPDRSMEATEESLERADMETILQFPMRRTCPWLPPPEYAELRKGPPRKVRLPNGLEAWIVTRYEDVQLALSDPRFSVDHTQPGFPLRIQVPPTPRGQSFFRMDEPEHGRLRRMIMPQFTARSTRELRPVVEGLIGELLDEMAAGPPVIDLVQAFTQPLPTLVLAAVFGVPKADQRMFARMTRAILAQDLTPEEVYAAALEMGDYLKQLIAAKERDPGGDLLSRLVTDHLAKGELTHDDLVAMARLILVAGYETSAKQLALSFLALLRSPGHLAQLRDDPALIKPAVQELLRYWAVSEDNMGKLALEDIEISGAHIAKGDAVVIAIPAANHDERHFPDPGRLDFHRDAGGHMTFGWGPRYCPGAPLAVMELELALPAMFERFPGLRLAADPEELHFLFPNLVYGVTALPVAR
ncbi:cytochrome P450 [Streptosporangiaceae bacterium NEAU-GS5]|nr:cytochrome P450 [Streptosporangiaceae bacterium NEAU-GS5]